LLNKKKTKISGPGDPKVVTGLALNETIDIPAEFYENLNKDLNRLKNVFEATLLIGPFEENSLLKKYKQEIQGEINFIGMVEGFHSPQFKEYTKKYRQSFEANEEFYSMRWTHFGYL
jgi:hypothetical protein